MALVKCKDCKKEVSKKAKVCPHCGVDKPAVTKSTEIIQGIIGLFVLILIVAAIFGGKKENEAEMKSAPEIAKSEIKKVTPAPVKSESQKKKEWYEGGTLHQANALEWQKASHANKLATIGDMVAGLYNKKAFKSEIENKAKTMDGVKALALEVVEQMDIALEPVTDADENKRLFEHQEVASYAVMVMALMGWLK